MVQLPEPAWMTAERIDAETIARISCRLAPHLFQASANDPASVSGLVLEAAEVFQLIFFSFDPLYWDVRDYPATVEDFIASLVSVLQREPEWFNEQYSYGRENLLQFLRRHEFDMHSCPTTDTSEARQD